MIERGPDRDPRSEDLDCYEARNSFHLLTRY
jgi:hypothetical protein